MSRTVHHTPNRHRTAPAYWPHGTAGPCTAHALAELRYSRAELSRARREGRRPRPERVVRAFAAYTYPRGLGERWTSPYEKSARAALQVFQVGALHHLRATSADALLAAAETLDHPPTRHRHRDLWEA